MPAPARLLRPVFRVDPRAALSEGASAPEGMARWAGRSSPLDPQCTRVAPPIDIAVAEPGKVTPTLVNAHRTIPMHQQPLWTRWSRQFTRAAIKLRYGPCEFVNNERSIFAISQSKPFSMRLRSFVTRYRTKSRKNRYGKSGLFCRLCTDAYGNLSAPPFREKN